MKSCFTTLASTALLRRPRLCLVAIFIALSPLPAAIRFAPGDLLHADDFENGLGQWVVEQQPGGTVHAGQGHLRISDTGGVTVWFRHRLDAPVVITYTALSSSRGRVSDLNCFWMAIDPLYPEDLFHEGHTRTGAFATYDTLQTYYVGYGGNHNTTTRFRRYQGSGARPLLPEHDLSDPAFLLIPDSPYQIMLIAAEGWVQYVRNGELVFSFLDPDFLDSGWFGFRTVWSELEISEFRVWRAVPMPGLGSKGDGTTDSGPCPD